MARALQRSTSRPSRLHLICAVCQEVYRSPRILPQCFHSFCVQCLEGMAQTHGSIFPCPTCRTTVSVPAGGVHCFKVNFYISEEDLELERRQASRPMCEVHPTEEVVFFCKPCVQAICLRCKLTKHESHHTLDLSEVADQCQGELRSSHSRLAQSVARLTNEVALSQANLSAARQKADLLKEQVNERHDSFITLMTTQRDRVLRDLDTLTSALDIDLSADVATIQRHLDSLVQLQQRVFFALEERDQHPSYNDAEVLMLDREVREGQGSVEAVRRVEGSLPQGTHRPGLEGGLCGVLRPQDLAALLFGTPVRLHLPINTPVENVTPLYRCEERDNGSRVVDAVRYLMTGHIRVAYGGTAPAYEDQAVVTIKLDAHGVTAETPVPVKRKVSFLGQGSQAQEVIYSKSNEETRVVLECQRPPKAILPPDDIGQEEAIEFELEDAWTPLAVDADFRQEILIVLSEVPSPPSPAAGDISSTTIPPFAGYTPANYRRLVQMYVSGQSRPVTCYDPPQQPFFPTDICFKDGGHFPRPLLISDKATDNVHVVSVKNNQFQFLRYLASGSPYILQPTALDTFMSQVFVGCENGWVLRCEFNTPFTSEDSDREEEEEVEEAEEMEEVEEV